jgi:REP-associated tyrosine transposase
MARKWSNLNLPGALHFVTGNFINRLPVFSEDECCKVFLEELKTLNQNWPSKLIAYVLMPDHFHLIANPRDGRIREFTRNLKRNASKAIQRATRRFTFPETSEGHQVWQESFKATLLWTGYIHANPVKAGIVKSAKDYPWTSFRSFYSQGDEPLAVEHDWWWPEDAEKLSRAMKELDWRTYWK